jgi:hypothetical protein
MKMSQPFMVEVVCWVKRTGACGLPEAADAGAIARIEWIERVARWRWWE